MTGLAATRKRRQASVLARLCSRWSSGLALAWILAVGLAAVLAEVLPFGDPSAVHLDRKLEPPSTRALAAGSAASALGETDSARWILPPLSGTDDLGRCVLARLVFGARTSLLVGAVASLISLVLGVLVGAVSGWRGGRIDIVLMRMVDVLYALPLMFLVIFVVALLRGVRKEHPDLAIDQTLVLFAVLGGVSWLTMARIVRAETLALKQSPFIEAAITAGLSGPAVFRNHVLNNILPVILVTLTVTIPRVILLEAFLSFLGLGVEAPAVSWGLLARQGYDALTAVHISWWLVLFPGLALSLTLLALNHLGDALRDALDPRSAVGT